jgi:lipoprotein-anchoring transpeptidase ErfK/SrfK
MSANNKLSARACTAVFGAVLVLGVAVMLLTAPAFAQSQKPRDGAPGVETPGVETLGVDTSSDQLPIPLRRQIVSYPGNEPTGTIIIDTAHTFLYLTLGGGEALRYGIGVGREGFTWSGVEKISRKTEWPDWIPPTEMIARQPYLPRWVGGGPGNPLGARALYLGNTAYRIHGTNNPSSIGKHVSSGCIRLRDADVIDLYGRVGIGAKVIVLPNDQPQARHDQRETWRDDAHSVAISPGNGGVMTARIFITPVSAERARQRESSTGNPTLFGLY